MKEMDEVQDEGESKPIVVALRPKPNLEKDPTCLEVDPDSNLVTLKIPSSENNEPPYTMRETFNYALASSDTQDTLYTKVISQYVAPSLDGYDLNVIAYGQSGCGKTHALFGPPNCPQAGVVVKCVSDLFHHLEKKRNNFRVSVSSVEIEEDEIHDILAPDTRTRPPKAIDCSSLSDVIQCMGNESSTDVSRLSECSSGIHKLFTVHIQQTFRDPECETVVKSSLRFFDLVGSDKVISNRGLLSLNNMVSNLGDARRKAGKSEPGTTLEQLLKDAFGGNSLTLLLCCVSSLTKDVEETENVLRFAQCASNISNNPKPHVKITPLRPTSRGDRAFSQVRSASAGPLVSNFSSMSPRPLAPLLDLPTSNIPAPPPNIMPTPTPVNPDLLLYLQMQQLMLQQQSQPHPHLMKPLQPQYYAYPNSVGLLSPTNALNHAPFSPPMYWQGFPHNNPTTPSDQVSIPFNLSARNIERDAFNQGFEENINDRIEEHHISKQKLASILEESETCSSGGNSSSNSNLRSEDEQDYEISDEEDASEASDEYDSEEDLNSEDEIGKTSVHASEAVSSFKKETISLVEYFLIDLQDNLKPKFLKPELEKLEHLHNSSSKVDPDLLGDMNRQENSHSNETRSKPLNLQAAPSNLPPSNDSLDVLRNAQENIHALLKKMVKELNRAERMGSFGERELVEKSRIECDEIKELIDYSITNLKSDLIRLDKPILDSHFNEVMNNFSRDECLALIHYLVSRLIDFRREGWLGEESYKDLEEEYKIKKKSARYLERNFENQCRENENLKRENRKLKEKLDAYPFLLEFYRKYKQKDSSNSLSKLEDSPHSAKQSATRTKIQNQKLIIENK